MLVSEYVTMMYIQHLHPILWFNSEHANLCHKGVRLGRQASFHQRRIGPNGTALSGTLTQNVRRVEITSCPPDVTNDDYE